MSETLNFKSWDDSSTYSSNFKMISKYTDLGSPDGKKSILGVICNVTVGTESTASSHSTYSFLVQYRTSLNGRFETLAVFSNYYNSGIRNKGTIEKIHMLTRPIKNIHHVQLQIKGIGIRNDFGINDIGLIFRTYRDSNTGNFDEG